MKSPSPFVSWAGLIRANSNGYRWSFRLAGTIPESRSDRGGRLRRTLGDGRSPTPTHRRMRTGACELTPAPGATERPARTSAPSGGPIHLRERLGQRVGEILEHIRRVIRFDQVIRGHEVSPLPDRTIEDVGLETAVGGDEKLLVVVVDDRELAKARGEVAGRAVECIED